MAKTYVRSIKFSQNGAVYWVRDADTKERVDVLESIVENKADASSVYTKSEINDILDGKQDKLTAGANITIENNVISATGGLSDSLWEEGTGEGSIVSKPNASQGGQAIGNYSIAEGFGSDAKGNYSHAEGQLTTTNGNCAHAEGSGTTAQGNCAHAEGMDTVAQNQSEHAEGQFNASHKTSNSWGNAGNTLHSIGIGTGGPITDLDRRNAVEVMQNGDYYMIGVGGYTGANFSEADTVQEVLKNNESSSYVYEKLDDHLYYTDFDESEKDEQYAMNFFEKLLHNKDTVETPMALRLGGACSSIRKGNFYGRNYDWYYDNKSSFVVHNKAINGKIESIGVAQSIFEDLGDNIRLIPYLMLDGVNACGVFVNNNVVPTGDMGKTTGTHADLPGDYICMLMLPRYILDHFTTATAAVNWIRDEAKIYAPYSANAKIELHFMIGDSTKTYIVEFINNEAVISDVTNSKLAIMTNFYKQGTTYDENGHVEFDSVTNYGAGLERFNLLVDGYDSVESAETMRSCIDSVKYTQSYTLIYNDGGVNPNCWKTEFAADYSDSTVLPHPMDLHANSPLSDYVTCGVLDLVYQFYLNRSRDENPPRTWQTVHSSVYDFSSQTLNLKVQEQNKEYTFTFPVKGGYVAGDGIAIKDNKISLAGNTQTVLDSEASSIEELVADYNSLLMALRKKGVIA